MDLTGKVAVVTGSGRGLGLAYATELARSGAAVVVNDVDEAVADAAVKSIADAGGTAVAEVVRSAPARPPRPWSTARSTSSAGSTSWSTTPASSVTRRCGR